MSKTKAGILAFVLRYLATLRFPYLLVVTAALFVVDLLVPDVIPFADEILLALLTILLARIKRTDADER
jgi:hypothetical protein